MTPDERRGVREMDRCDLRLIHDYLPAQSKKRVQIVGDSCKVRNNVKIAQTRTEAEAHRRHHNGEH